MPGEWGSYLGFGNVPFQPQYGNAAASDYMNDWTNAWGAFLAPYLQQFGGSPFAQLLQQRGGQIERMYEGEQAQNLAAGGDLFTQQRPDDWLSAFDPMKFFLQHSPQERGEGRSGTPFTTWRSW